MLPVRTGGGFVTVENYKRDVDHDVAHTKIVHVIRNAINTAGCKPSRLSNKRLSYARLSRWACGFLELYVVGLILDCDSLSNLSVVVS